MERGLTEAKFIQLGMSKDKWPCVTVELIQGFLDDPELLGVEDSDFTESFFKYMEWYNEI